METPGVSDWVQLSVYPCPDTIAPGSPTPLPCPMKPNCDCDGFESCLTEHFGCFVQNRSATCAKTQVGLAKFMSCFEGFKGHKEPVCNYDQTRAAGCMTTAGFGPDDITAVEKCYNDKTANKAAQTTMFNRCQFVGPRTGGPAYFPFFDIDNDKGKTVGRNFDPTSMPILGYFCKAYKGTPKPAACKGYL